MNFPCYESGQTIAAATVAATVALAGTASRLQSATDVLFYNPGPNLVHVRAGGADVAAANTTCAPVPAGALWSYGKGNATHLSVIAIGGPQNLLAIVAQGA